MITDTSTFKVNNAKLAVINVGALMKMEISVYSYISKLAIILSLS